MRIGKYLKFHFKSLEDGQMPTDGLCNYFHKDSFTQDRFLKLFEPDFDDLQQLYREDVPRTYWGRLSWDKGPDDYTAFRQTIVLFMAAMNNEL